MAGMAGCASPDGLDSAGADWLRQVASSAAEVVAEVDDIDDARYDDRLHEMADGLVPIYTHNRWQVFVDLAAYQEDVTEFGPIEDMERAAGVALYIIAERLVAAIIEDTDR